MKIFGTIVTVLFFSLITLGACSQATPQEQSAHDQSVGNRIVNNGIYFMDRKTNLCFFSYGPGEHYGMMASVPCSPEVLQKVVN